MAPISFRETGAKSNMTSRFVTGTVVAVLAAGLLVISGLRPADAWGRIGHRVISRLAKKQRDQARELLDQSITIERRIIDPERHTGRDLPAELVGNLCALAAD
jgi:hypothetical protein